MMCNASVIFIISMIETFHFPQECCRCEFKHFIWKIRKFFQLFTSQLLLKSQE